MINHIKSIWDDIEIVQDMDNFEKSIFNRYLNQIQDGVLLKREDRLYVAGWHQDDILIFDNESEKPLIRLSGKLK